MKLRSSIRRAAAFLTLISLLFMLLATASYACPAREVALSQVALSHETLSQVAQSEMPMPCGSVDHNQPGLCHANASDIGNKLSLDKPDVPNVHDFLPVRMAQTIDLSIYRLTGIDPQTSLDISPHATAPPFTVLHCCFRI